MTTSVIIDEGSQMYSTKKALIVAIGREMLLWGL